MQERGNFMDSFPANYFTVKLITQIVKSAGIAMFKTDFFAVGIKSKAIRMNFTTNIIG